MCSGLFCFPLFKPYRKAFLKFLLADRFQKKYSMRSRNVHADFFEYERGEDFLKAAGKSPFTILFLDIYMNGINGIETAKKLRSFDKDCLLIFTTTSTDHALERFQVRATHYLVKPYTDKDLSALTEELLSRIPEPGRSENICFRLRAESPVWI